MSKILIIERCGECKHLSVYGRECRCQELERSWADVPRKIPRDCPLEDEESYMGGVISSIC